MKKLKWALVSIVCFMALALVLMGCDLNNRDSSQTEVIVTNNTTIEMSVTLSNNTSREGYRDYYLRPEEKATWSWDNPPIGDSLYLVLIFDPLPGMVIRPAIQFVLEEGKNSFSARYSRYSGASGQTVTIEPVR